MWPRAATAPQEASSSYTEGLGPDDTDSPARSCDETCLSICDAPGAGWRSSLAAPACAGTTVQREGHPHRTTPHQGGTTALRVGKGLHLGTWAPREGLSAESRRLAGECRVSWAAETVCKGPVVLVGGRCEVRVGRGWQGEPNAL